MNIDGRNGLTCLTKIASGGPTMITPLPHMFIIKDLVADMINIYNQYKSIEPWLEKPAEEPWEGEPAEQGGSEEARCAPAVAHPAPATGEIPSLTWALPLFFMPTERAPRIAEAKHEDAGETSNYSVMVKNLEQVVGVGLGDIAAELPFARVLVSVGLLDAAFEELVYGRAVAVAVEFERSFLNLAGFACKYTCFIPHFSAHNFFSAIL
ncbi:Sdh2-1p [Orobanche minor]